ncbi:MAG: AAA family ATPase [Pseudomonadales bacterium]|nr:AAA family ATPase [Pseudomonadales bacterium]MCP5215951.1 AAA family ATPase [Pseudomonadales bacterium]
MYLQHFGLNEMPFSLTPNTHFFLNVGSHKEAMNLLLVGLDNAAGFIKIIGEVGTGKTILCRKLLNSLDERYVTAYIPNPHLTPAGMRIAFAEELGVTVHRNEGQHAVLKKITERLIELAQQNKLVVLLIDEAQAMPEETIEALRLLTNLETETQKLLQVVLFGQPELDELLNRKSLRQLKQRITFSCYLKPLELETLDRYITHRMSGSGYNGEHLFKPAALKLLHRASGGVPRLINILCHKALMVAYGKGDHRIEKAYVQRAIQDTEGVASVISASSYAHWGAYAILLLLAACGVFLAGRMAL